MVWQHFWQMSNIIGSYSGSNKKNTIRMSVNLLYFLQMRKTKCTKKSIGGMKMSKTEHAWLVPKDSDNDFDWKVAWVSRFFCEKVSISKQ